MATPTVPEGRLMAAAAKKASTWGTAVALGAGNGIYIEEDGGLKPSRPYLPAKETDSPYVQEGTLGPHEAVDFTPTGTFRYDGGALIMLLAMLFGTAGVPDNLTGGAYGHTFQWADNLSSLFATWAIERRGKIWEVSSVKPMSFELSVSDGLIKFALGLRGSKCIDDSAVNMATQMDAITYAAVATRAEFADCKIYLNGFSDADVEDAAYELEVSDLTLNFSRSPDAVPVAGDDHIIEPLEEDWPTGVLDLSFPRMNATNAAYFADFNDQSLKKCIVKILSTVEIGGGNYYCMYIYLPNLRITDLDFPHGPIIPGSLQLTSEECASAPTGMSYKRPYIYLYNTASTDYLA